MLRADYCDDPRLRAARAAFAFPWVAEMCLRNGEISDVDLDSAAAAEHLDVPEEMCAAAIAGMKREGVLVPTVDRSAWRLAADAPARAEH